MGSVFVSPSSVELSVSEELPLGFDATQLLEEITGSALTGPVAKVTDPFGNGVPSALSGAPSVAGNVVTQVVAGSALQAGFKYTITISFNPLAGLTAVMKRWIEAVA